MLNIGEGSSKYVTFWSVANAQEKYSDVKMSTSTKNKQTDEWENSNWYVRFVGHAHNKLSQLSEKDKIEITQGGIKTWYNKETKESKLNVVVFDFEMMDSNKSSAPTTSVSKDDFVSVEDDDFSDVPF